MIEIPIWEKSNLTLEEAAAYSGIGINKLRKLSDSESCPFVLWIGSKRLIKRQKLDEYTDRMYSLSGTRFFRIRYLITGRGCGIMTATPPFVMP